MKKNIRKKQLNVGREVIKTLDVDALAAVRGGCDTTSNPTEDPVKTGRTILTCPG